MAELLKYLQSGNGLHRIILHTCYYGSDADEMQIIQALKRHVVGIKMDVSGMISSQKEKLVRCVRQKVEEHPCIDELDDKKETEFDEDCRIEMRERSQMKEFHHWDMSAIILYASVGVVAAVFIAGSVWDAVRAHGQGKGTSVT